MPKQIFMQRTEETYATWRNGRLFSGYLTMMLALDEHGELHPNDLGELEKISAALGKRSLPEKFGFYRSLGDDNLRDIYLKKFILS